MEIKEFINKNLNNMINDLATLVSHNSVFAQDAQPFGKENRACLDDALKIFESKGLRTKNVDYYCGYGEVGEGNKLIGILGHLDIVPAGDGWRTNPFMLTEIDECLYGRGVSDDKGAVVASLYAIKYLLDEKYEFKKRVRLIVGCNEENGSAGIAYYNKHEEPVSYGFTPDGDFPGIYAEKGMITGKIIGHNSKIVDIEGGMASNIVCDKLVIKVEKGSFDENKLKAFLDERNIKFDLDVADVVTLTTYGRSSHGSTPDDGTNAINYALEALYAAGYEDTFVSFFHKNFALNNHASALGFKEMDDEVTDTTLNFGVAKKRGDDIILSVDLRFPVTGDPDTALALFEKCEDENNEFGLANKIEPLYYNINTPFIKALKKAYEDITGDTQTEMMAIGGGTYAKEMKNIIAYGCQFLGEDNNIHEKNERLTIDSFKKQVELYVEAIKNLNEMED